jgi:hypothetical protein
MAAAALLLGAPGVADAATAGTQGGTLTYTAAAGERNALAIKQGANAIVLGDPNATIKPGAGCTVDATGHQATCASAGITASRSTSAIAPTRSTSTARSSFP